MKAFIRSWVLASAGFYLFELATRPPRRPRPEPELSDRAAAMLIDLADLDRELREPRALCLCGCKGTGVAPFPSEPAA